VDYGPRWWLIFREVVTFTLGVVVMIDGLDVTGTGRNIGELIVGLVMIGVLPIERLLSVVVWRRNGHARRDS
jgi:hypothetical protein